MDYVNCIVLYTSSNCHYCNLLKSRGFEWLDRVIIHDIITQGWPIGGCALPELWVYGSNGQTLAKLCGANRTSNEYEGFMLKWGRYATTQ